MEEPGDMKSEADRASAYTKPCLYRRYTYHFKATEFVDAYH